MPILENKKTAWQAVNKLERLQAYQPEGRFGKILIHQYEKEDKIRGLKKGCPYQNHLWFFFPKICFSASETFCTAYSLVLGMNR
jgi:hypothetical protein